MLPCSYAHICLSVVSCRCLSAVVNRDAKDSVTSLRFLALWMLLHIVQKFIFGSLFGFCESVMMWERKIHEFARWWHITPFKPHDVSIVNFDLVTYCDSSFSTFQNQSHSDFVSVLYSDVVSTMYHMYHQPIVLARDGGLDVVRLD